jgi:hypothetical protein
MKLIDLVKGLLAGKQTVVSFAILAVVFVGGLTVGRFLCQPQTRIEVRDEPHILPPKRDNAIVDATRVERDSLRKELAALQKKLRPKNAETRRIDEVLALPIEEIPDIEIMKAQVEFPDSLLGRVDTVRVTSFGEPISKIEVELFRGPGRLADIDTVMAPVIIEGLTIGETAAVAGVFGVLMLVLGLVL